MAGKDMLEGKTWICREGGFDGTVWRGTGPGLAVFGIGLILHTLVEK